MGKNENKPFQLSFNGLLKVDFQGSRVTAEQDQELVSDELRTEVDEDRRSAGEARAVSLAAAGRGVSEPGAVR